VKDLLLYYAFSFPFSGMDLIVLWLQGESFLKVSMLERYARVFLEQEFYIGSFYRISSPWSHKRKEPGWMHHASEAPCLVAELRYTEKKSNIKLHHLPHVRQPQVKIGAKLHGFLEWQLALLLSTDKGRLITCRDILKSLLHFFSPYASTATSIFNHNAAEMRSNFVIFTRIKTLHKVSDLILYKW